MLMWKVLIQMQMRGNMEKFAKEVFLLWILISIFRFDKMNGFESLTIIKVYLIEMILKSSNSKTDEWLINLRNFTSSILEAAYWPRRGIIQVLADQNDLYLH